MIMMITIVPLKIIRF